MGWLGADAGDPPDYVGVEDALENLVGNMNNHVEWVGTTFELGTADPENPFVERATSHVGLAGGNMMPINNTFLAKKTTALGGRRQRGRNYFPGVSENAVTDGGLLEAGVAAGWNTNLQDCRTAMTALGYELALFHQSAPFAPTNVVDWQCEDTIATQRKRLLR
jgi:hypothetical protein